MKKQIFISAAFSLVFVLAVGFSIAQARIDNPPPSGVVGPGSGTDNAVVRFDGTDGATVQNSGVTINDSDLITIPGGFLSQASSTINSLHTTAWKTFSIATTTLTGRGAYGTAGTSTIIIQGFPIAVTLLSTTCGTDPISGNGTTTVRIGDGTNFTQYAPADDRPLGINTLLTTNNTFVARERIYIEFGNRISNADAISCTLNYLQ